MHNLRLKKIKEQFKRESEELKKREIEKKFYEERIAQLKLSIKEENLEINKLEKVVYLLKKTAEYSREQAKTQIEELVSFCLHFIFEEDISFIINFKDTKRNSAEFFVETKFNNLTVTTDPKDSRGGGVVDVVALALRIAFIQTAKPMSEGPIILDEPAKHVSIEYISRISDFIQEISKKMKRQIILITHSQNLSAIGDKSFYVYREKSQTIVKVN